MSSKSVIALGELRRPLLVLLLTTVTIAVLAVQSWWHRGLVTSAARSGMASLVRAADPVAATSVLESWDEATRATAAFYVGLDFLRIATVSSLVLLLCALSSTAVRSKSWRVAGAILTWGQLLAALLLASQDIGVVMMLFNGPNAPWPQLATWCAVLGFLLIATGVMYSAAALVARVSRGFSSHSLTDFLPGVRP